ncbi:MULTISPECIES: hypothetical protein [Bifidobacterium]|jgi:hypothetical protein|uniref:hypothetical protein n=1 Tax=Bifidobacterium TaxID=1678 RepID=UPI000A255461|nr:MULTISPECIES: hypothetical protein [Bifidobacterium]MDB1402402.1 hypothetical protein [Bifidobacterium adolescentis]OSG85702.1 hypothetical protein B0070_1097 [Bifidobacterium adolescentis]
MDKFRRGFGNLPPRWDAEYPWRLYYVDLYFTDTFQYAKLYTMRYPVERILANLGEVVWDESEADKKTGIFGYGMMWISPAI